MPDSSRERNFVPLKGRHASAQVWLAPEAQALPDVSELSCLAFSLGSRNRRLIPRAATGEPFVGWVQPTANGVRPVGCTHPTMTPSLAREV